MGALQDDQMNAAPCKAPQNALCTLAFGLLVTKGSGKATCLPQGVCVRNMFGQQQGILTAKRAAVVKAPTEICLPVTVRMLDDVTIAQLDTLILVGCVESAERNESDVRFIINDATGRVQVHLFLDLFSEDIVNLKAGVYVAIRGRMSCTFPRYVIAYGFHYVNSADEVSYHNIEAVHAFLKRRQMRYHEALR